MFFCVQKKPTTIDAPRADYCCSTLSYGVDAAPPPPVRATRPTSAARVLADTMHFFVSYLFFSFLHAASHCRGRLKFERTGFLGVPRLACTRFGTGAQPFVLSQRRRGGPAVIFRLGSIHASPQKAHMCTETPRCCTFVVPSYSRFNRSLFSFFRKNFFFLFIALALITSSVNRPALRRVSFDYPIRFIRWIDTARRGCRYSTHSSSSFVSRPFTRSMSTFLARPA